MKKSVYISDDLVKAIDDARAKERPLPSFSDMLSKLARRGLQGQVSISLIRYCDSCGRELPIERSRFCDGCGRELLLVL